MKDVEEAIIGALRSRIMSRVNNELKPSVVREIDRIVTEETASVALEISRRVSFQTMSDRIVIEVRKVVK